MGFSKFIYTVDATGTGTNKLNSRNWGAGLPALSTVYANYTDGVSAIAPAIKISSTGNEQLTCFVTDFTYVTLQDNGSPGFVYTNTGVVNASDGGVTFPYKLYYNSTQGFNTLSYNLSATGQECASGVQVAAVYWSLSSTALSGTSAGTNILVDVTNAGNPLPGDDGSIFLNTLSAQTTVYCINSPFPSSAEPFYMCQGEFSRKQGFFG